MEDVKERITMLGQFTQQKIRDYVEDVAGDEGSYSTLPQRKQK